MNVMHSPPFTRVTNPHALNKLMVAIMENSHSTRKHPSGWGNKGVPTTAHAVRAYMNTMPDHLYKIPMIMPVRLRDGGDDGHTPSPVAGIY